MDIILLVVAGVCTAVFTVLFLFGHDLDPDRNWATPVMSACWVLALVIGLFMIISKEVDEDRRNRDDWPTGAAHQR